MKIFTYIFTYFGNRAPLGEVVFMAGLSAIIFAFLLALFFGFITLETADSVFEDTTFIDEPQAKIVYIKRTVFFISLLSIFVSFFVAYDSAFPTVDVGTLPAVTQPIIYDPIPHIANSLSVSNSTVATAISALLPSVNSDNADIFLPYFDMLFSNVNNSYVDFSGFNSHIKSFIVRSLVRIYANEDYFEDIVLPGAEAYLEAPQDHSKTSLVYIYYILTIVLGHTFN
jgi:hypothetical protein